MNSPLWKYPVARPDLLQMLRESAAAGKSASQTATELGMGLTRSAVLGLASRADPVIHFRAQVRTPKPLKVEKVKPSFRAPRKLKSTGTIMPNPEAVAPLPEPERKPLKFSIVSEVVGEPVPLLKLRDNHCRRPLWDDDTKPASVEERLFCGNHTEPGKSYCDECSRLMYTPVVSKAARAALAA